MNASYMNYDYYNICSDESELCLVDHKGFARQVGLKNIYILKKIAVAVIVVVDEVIAVIPL